VKARIRDGNIDERQAMALLVVAVGAKIFLFFPRVMVTEAASAGWMVVLGSAFFAGALVLVLTRLMMGFGRDCSLVEAVGGELGLPGALIVGVPLFLVFFANMALTARQLAEALITTVLPHTPISVITAVFFLAAMYGAYLGIEPISRVASLVVPWTLFGVLLGGMLVLPHTRVDQIYPLLGYGADLVLARSLTGMGHFTELSLILVIRPFLRCPERAARLTVGSAALLGLGMAAVVAQFVMVFAVPLAYAVTFPLLQMIQLVFQRVEAGFIFVWVAVGMLKMAVNLYASCLVLSRSLGLPVWRPLVFPLTTLAFAINFMPESMVEALEWELYLRNWAGLAAFGLPIAMLGISRLKRGLGNRGSGSSGA